MKLEFLLQLISARKVLIKLLFNVSQKMHRNIFCEFMMQQASTKKIRISTKKCRSLKMAASETFNVSRIKNASVIASEKYYANVIETNKRLLMGFDGEDHFLMKFSLGRIKLNIISFGLIHFYLW